MSDDLEAARAHVDRVVEDTVANIGRVRGLVRLAADDAEVRYIARHAARLTLGLERNLDRELAGDVEGTAELIEPRELEAGG